ncbi:hypothetical protein NA57DRAFT_41830 [Rhizodiscina lignyota]|uniref:Uncharacterized protein n=1 Tax=Rhizodiscina lignyota TaxID=1504668 RepID=A0A9P4M4B2_9PEZI|nr:hypothetical protein NA57DRAFT_41830 [Rhizodiscina lignyota]
MKVRELVSHFFLFTFCFATSVLGTINESAFTASDIITRDVVIIGGGSSGTYTAIRLQQLGKSVALIERKSILGGHVDTFYDPITRQTFDFGVVLFENISVVTNYFAHLDVELAKFSSLGVTVQSFADITKMEKLTNASLPSPNATAAALTKFGEILNKYPYLYNGFNDLQYPVPEDLLLPFGDFMEKYQLNALAYQVMGFLQGGGNLLNQTSLYVMKYLAKIVGNFLKDNFLTTAAHDNHELYVRALERLGPNENAFVNASVTEIERCDTNYAYSGHDQGSASIDECDTPVNVVFNIQSGAKLVKASQLVIAIPPLLENLQFLDLSSEERSLFGQFGNTYYWDAVVRNSGIPRNTSISNFDPNAPSGLPRLPGIYDIGPSGVKDLDIVYYGSPYPVENVEVANDIMDKIAGLVKVYNFPPNRKKPELVGFHDHRPYGLFVSAEVIKNGFYKNLLVLQGRRNTYYTGAAWQVHDSSRIWNWTEMNIIPKLSS